MNLDSNAEAVSKLVSPAEKRLQRKKDWGPKGPKNENRCQRKVDYSKKVAGGTETIHKKGLNEAEYILKSRYRTQFSSVTIKESFLENLFHDVMQTNVLQKGSRHLYSTGFRRC